MDQEPPSHSLGKKTKKNLQHSWSTKQNRSTCCCYCCCKKVKHRNTTSWEEVRGVGVGGAAAKRQQETDIKIKAKLSNIKARQGVGGGGGGAEEQRIEMHPTYHQLSLHPQNTLTIAAKLQSPNCEFPSLPLSLSLSPSIFFFSLPVFTYYNRHGSDSFGDLSFHSQSFFSPLFLFFIYYYQAWNWSLSQCEFVISLFLSFLLCVCFFFLVFLPVFTHWRHGIDQRKCATFTSSIFCLTQSLFLVASASAYLHDPATSTITTRRGFLGKTTKEISFSLCAHAACWL